MPSLHGIWIYYTNKTLNFPLQLFQHIKLVADLKQDIINTSSRHRKELIRVIRENLLEDVPQPMLYGRYYVSTSLMVTIYGFVVSYSLVVQEIVDPLKLGISIQSNDSVRECFETCATWN